MSSKMEQIIEEIEDYIDGCKPSPISRNKILVNREQLEELLSELRTKTPEEVKRYQMYLYLKLPHCQTTLPLQLHRHSLPVGKAQLCLLQQHPQTAAVNL